MYSQAPHSLISYLLSHHYFIFLLKFATREILLKTHFTEIFYQFNLFVFFASTVTNSVVIVLVTTLKIDSSQL